MQPRPTSCTTRRPAHRPTLLTRAFSPLLPPRRWGGTLLLLVILGTLLAPTGALGALGASANTRGPAVAAPSALGPVHGAPSFAGWSPTSGRSSPGVGPDRLSTVALLPARPAGFVSTPTWLAYDPNDRSMFVGDPPDSVDQVAIGTHLGYQVNATIGVGDDPFGVAVDTAQHEVFVADSGSNNVSVINDTNLTDWTSVPVGAGPRGLAYDPSTGNVYVANNGSDNVTVFNASDLRAVANIAVGSGPVGVAADPAADRVFVADSLSDQVSVINTTTNNVVATLAAGSFPYGVALDNTTGSVFVTNEGSYNLTVLNGSNLSLLATIPVLSPFLQVQGIAYDPATDSMWVGAGYSYAIEVSASAFVVAGYFETDPSGAAYDPANGAVCLTNTGNNTFVCISAPVAGTDPVSFHESGLPLGTFWSVVVGQAYGHNTTVTSPTSYLNVSVAPWTGPYLYWVPTVPGYGNYLASPAEGNFSSGSVSLINISFAPAAPGPYNLSFVESGLPNGTSWSVDVGHGRYYGNATSITLSVANGTYAYTVVGVPGYVASPASGQARIQGVGVEIPISFSSLNVSLAPSVSPDPADAGANVTFEAGIRSGTPAGNNTTEAWIVESSPSCAAPPCYVHATGPEYVTSYDVAGVYEAWLWANGSASGSLSATLNVTVVPSLQLLAILASPAGGSPSTRSEAFGLNLSGGVAPYQAWWSFSDGGNGTGLALNHTFSGTGAEWATVEVSDSGGVRVSGSWNATPSTNASPAPLVAQALGTYQAGAAPLTENFSGSATGGTAPYSFQWSFGDGGTATVANVSHVYTSPGTYNATLVVTDAASVQATSTWTVYVENGSAGAPRVTLSAEPSEVLVGQSTVVRADVSGGQGGYTLDWGGQLGGCAPISPLAQRCTFATLGSRAISLQVIDANGQAGTATVSVAAVATLPHGSQPVGAPSPWSRLDTPVGLVLLASILVTGVVAAALVARRRGGARPPEAVDPDATAAGTSTAAPAASPSAGEGRGPGDRAPPPRTGPERPGYGTDDDPMADFL